MTRTIVVTPTHSAPRSIVLDGRREGKGHLVYIDGQCATIAPQMFALLTRLTKRATNWCRIEELVNPPENAAKYLYRLKNILVKQYGIASASAMIENDKNFSYRLVVAPGATIEINEKVIAADDDPRISELVR